MTNIQSVERVKPGAAPLVTVMYVLRRGRRLSQQELADSTGIAQPTISWIERGGETPQHHIDKLATFFGVAKRDLQREYSEYLRDETVE